MVFKLYCKLLYQCEKTSNVVKPNNNRKVMLHYNEFTASKCLCD